MLYITHILLALHAHAFVISFRNGKISLLYWYAVRAKTTHYLTILAIPAMMVSAARRIECVRVNVSVHLPSVRLYVCACVRVRLSVCVCARERASVCMCPFGFVFVYVSLLSIESVYRIEIPKRQSDSQHGKKHTRTTRNEKEITSVMDREREPNRA